MENDYLITGALAWSAVGGMFNPCRVKAKTINA
jgi:hypothetical protein